MAAHGHTFHRAPERRESAGEPSRTQLLPEPRSPARERACAHSWSSLHILVTTQTSQPMDDQQYTRASLRPRPGCPMRSLCESTSTRLTRAGFARPNLIQPLWLLATPLVIPPDNLVLRTPSRQPHCARRPPDDHLYNPRDATPSCPTKHPNLRLQPTSLSTTKSTSNSLQHPPICPNPTHATINSYPKNTPQPLKQTTNSYPPPIRPNSLLVIFPSLRSGPFRHV